jgi:hypothetical protein
LQLPYASIALESWLLEVMDVTFHMEGMLLSPSPPASSTPSVLLSPGGFTGQCPAPSTPWGMFNTLLLLLGLTLQGRVA